MRYIKKILLFIFVFSILFTPVIVSADSGWDSDYSSGSGDSWSSGGYSGGDYYSDDNGWSYDTGDFHKSSKSSNSNTNSVAFSIFFFIILILIMVYRILSITSRQIPISEDKEKKEALLTDQDELVKSYFSDLNEKKLLEILVNKFLEIQKAWMDFDYESLEKLCTKELYQSYKSDLEILKSKNEQNIMNNFKLVAENIKSITEEDGMINILMYLRMDFTDYVVDTSNGEVVRGNNSGKVVNQYDINFVISKNVIDKCPNCGALLDDNTCSHCDTYVDRGYSDFVMSSKTKIS